MRGVPTFPNSWPSWLTAPRLAFSLVAVAATVTTGVFTIWIPANAWERLALLLFGGLTSFLLARWACTTRDPGSAVARSLGGGAFQAFVSAAVLLPVFSFIHQHLKLDDLGSFVGLAITSAILSVPVGGVIGLCYAVLPAIAAHTRSEPSHGDVARVLGYGGLWLLLVAAVHGGIGAAIGGAFDPFASEPAFLATFAGIPLVLGGVCLVLASAHALARWRFLAKVEDGLDPRYRIVEKAALSEPPAAMPLDYGLPTRDCQRVLIRIAQEPRERLYRDAATPETEDEAVALLR